MEVHVEETLVTLGTFVLLAAAVSTGMVFKLVGVPSITVLNYPFHYFWFVAGAWVSLFVGFGVYHRYIGRLEAKKEALRNEAETPESTGATNVRTSAAHADEE